MCVCFVPIFVWAGHVGWWFWLHARCCLQPRGCNIPNLINPLSISNSPICKWNRLKTGYPRIQETKMVICQEIQVSARAHVISLLISSSVSPLIPHKCLVFHHILTCWQQTSYSWIVSRWCPNFFSHEILSISQKSTWVKASSQLHLPDRAYPAPESWRAQP